METVSFEDGDVLFARISNGVEFNKLLARYGAEGAEYEGPGLYFCKTVDRFDGILYKISEEKIQMMKDLINSF